MAVADLGVVGLARSFAQRERTPRDALDAYLSRIAARNPRLHAFLDLDEAGAAGAAQASTERWERNAPLSAIDGVSMGVKANIAVKGLPWHAGIGAYRNRLAASDAEVVARLRAAGAIILGTLNMHEGALGATTDNPWFGRTVNPYREGFTAGGSSGGSGAAVAAGLCAAALGTDTMGSVRIPSAYCGIFGYKPARGAVSNEGVIALSSTLDHVGVHARSAQDCAAVLRVICGASLPDSPGILPGTRLAALDFSGQVDVMPETASAFAALVSAARDAGLTVESCRLADYDFGRMRRAGLLISEVEGSAEHNAMLRENPDGFSPEFRNMLAWGKAQPADKLAQAYRLLADTASRITAQLAKFDALLLPTAPQSAFAFTDPVPPNQADFTALANFLGWPACAFPVGCTVDGLPLSAQIMARDDATVLSLTRSLAVSIPVPAGFAD